MSQKTTMQKPVAIKRSWHLFDAQARVLGSLATEVATVLIGKQKRDYTPHLDGGDYAVVINAAQVVLTGKKETAKLYYRHTGHSGGLKVRTAAEVRATQPERLVEMAVSKMLPKNKLRSGRMVRLKVFAGAEHPYTHQVTKEQDGTQKE